MMQYARQHRALIVLAACAVLGGVYLARLCTEVLGGIGPFHGNHHDFLAFYGAAWLSFHGAITQVYNADSMSAFQRTILSHPVGAAGYMPFINPPFYAAVLVPLALGSIEGARLVWLLINVLLLGVSAIWLTKSVRGFSRWIVAVAIIGSYPMYQALIEGQPSILMLFCSLAAIRLWLRKRYVLSGLCLIPLAIKPQFFVVVLIGLCVIRGWRTLVASIAGLGALIITLLPITGYSIYGEYARYLGAVTLGHLEGAGRVGNTAWQGALDHTSGVNGFFAALFGQQHTTLVNIATLIVGLAVMWVVVRARSRIGTIQYLNYPVLGGIGLLLFVLDPHLYGQDIVLLFALFYLAAQAKPTPKLLATTYVLANVAVLDQGLPFHLFLIGTLAIAHHMISSRHVVAISK